MTIAVIAVGAAAQLVAWWVVAARGVSVWTSLAPVLVVAGVAALAVRPPSVSGRVDVWLSGVAGVGVGCVLYLATRAFVAVVAGRWATFVRHARAIYREGGMPVATAIGAAAIVAVGEEIFWRGLAQRDLGSRLGASLAGAAVAWLSYVVANAASRNLAILAGAVVGGAVWTALAWWTFGIAASAFAHVTWTALMIARPVVREDAAA